MQIENPETNNILHKHLSAVHSSSSLTMMQRKTYNILLKNAIRNIHEDRVHQISVKDLKEALGWSENSNTNDDLKERLKELARTQVEWNILDKDKKNKWTASTLLADVSIKGSDIFYSYSLSLQNVLASPNVYAKLNMEVQKLLTNKYALIVWEIICGDLSVKRQNKSVSEWIPYESVLKLLDLVGTCYEKRYALFRNQVMSVAISEINEKSDLRVVVEERVENRAIKSIRFITERKLEDYIPEILPQEHKLFQKLVGFGFPTRIIENFLKTHDEKDLERAIDFYEYHIKKEKVHNPVAFFEKSLEKGWIVPIKEPIQSICNDQVDKIKDDISSLGEHPLCAALRLKIIEELGVANYKSWFKQARFYLVDNQLRIEVKSEFQKEYLICHFKAQIELFIKSDIHSIQDIKICVL